MEHNQTNHSNSQTSIDSQTEYEGLSFEKTAIVILILAVITSGIVWHLKANKPEAKKSGPKQSVVSVNASKPDIRDYIVSISSNGSASAKTNSTLVAQVSGEITSISEQFSNGSSFSKGDLLLTIDQRNFNAAVSSASANLSQAESNLETEQALAAQAKKDWERLGYDGEPNARVLRKPQLDAATAQFKAAKAAYSKARLDLSRTRIRAPYHGNVIERSVGLGQFVTLGTPLGNIFSNDGLEILLPVNQEEYAQLDFSSKPKVILHTELAGTQHEWSATVVRADRAFNTATRQLNVVAEVDNIISNNGLELKVGQYINANINGQTLSQASVIPNSAVREGSYVFIFDEGILRRKNISIIWQDDDVTIVNNLDAEDLVVTTSLGGAVSGSKAKLIGDTKKNTPKSDSLTPSAPQ